MTRHKLLLSLAATLAFSASGTLGLTAIARGQSAPAETVPYDDGGDGGGGFSTGGGSGSGPLLVPPCFKSTPCVVPTGCMKYGSGSGFGTVSATGASNGVKSGSPARPCAVKQGGTTGCAVGNWGEFC